MHVRLVECSMIPCYSTYTGETERFDQLCVVVKDKLTYHAGPVLDLSMDVDRHINRTGFPQNDEPLIIYLLTVTFQYPGSYRTLIKLAYLYAKLSRR